MTFLNHLCQIFIFQITCMSSLFLIWFFFLFIFYHWAQSKLINMFAQDIILLLFIFFILFVYVGLFWIIGAIERIFFKNFSHKIWSLIAWLLCWITLSLLAHINKIFFFIYVGLEETAQCFHTILSKPIHIVCISVSDFETRGLVSN